MEINYIQKDNDSEKKGDRQVPNSNSSVVGTEPKDEIKNKEQKETNSISEKENKMTIQKQIKKNYFVYLVLIKKRLAKITELLI